jgi:hypothetical protein
MAHDYETEPRAAEHTKKVQKMYHFYTLFSTPKNLQVKIGNLMVKNGNSMVKNPNRYRRFDPMGRR